jgi:hypothetical protein
MEKQVYIWTERFEARRRLSFAEVVKRRENRASTALSDILREARGGRADPSLGVPGLQVR